DSSFAPPGNAFPIPAIFMSPTGAATNAALGGGPGWTDAAEATVPVGPRVGQNPKLEKTPPTGAGSPSATTFLKRFSSATKRAEATDAPLRRAMKATEPV